LVGRVCFVLVCGKWGYADPFSVFAACDGLYEFEVWGSVVEDGAEGDVCDGLAELVEYVAVAGDGVFEWG
jgi:hypothetical protein